MSYANYVHNGSYDDLHKEVIFKIFYAAIGDIMIKLGEEFQLVEFSQPYVGEARLLDKSQPWLFAELEKNDLVLPNTTRDKEMEQRELDDGWRSLREIVEGNLTSIISNSQISASTVDVNMLKSQNAAISCDGSSFIIQYLVKDLGFKRKNIRSMASIDDYAEALSSGKIKAAFNLMPYAKVFLAKYCSGFTIAGPTYKLGGFGFAFQKGSTLSSDILEAILRLSESGELQLMEEEMLTTFNCSGSPSDANTPLHGSNDYNPWPNLHTVSKASSVSNSLINHAFDSPHYDFQENMMGSILQDSSMKYADYRHKQLKNNINVIRKQLKIVVPMKSTFKQFVEVRQDVKNIVGFSTDVFLAAVRLLPHKFIYQMIPFNDSYDDLL